MARRGGGGENATAPNNDGSRATLCQKSGMTAPTKGELERTVKRLYAISLALLRAETAYEKYHEEATKLFASDKSDDELEAEIPNAVTQLQNNGLIRTGSLLSVYFGLLYSVIEAWRNWTFVDAAVDTLLQSPYVKDLKQYRNAIFHVSEAADPRIMQWSFEKERVVCTNELSVSLRAAILEYHKNLAARVTVHFVKPNR